MQDTPTALDDDFQPISPSGCLSEPVKIPKYLQKHYWWAYLHPRSIKLFERQWIINLILWGNYSRLCDIALTELGSKLAGRTLQVACVYGNLSTRIAARLTKQGQLDIVDVASMQLENLKSKIDDFENVSLHLQDATQLQFDDAVFDNALLFFLLHEQPEAVRTQALIEAVRVIKPGGKLVIVDYHQPVRLNPFRYIMTVVLGLLEPFALSLWRTEIVDMFPENGKPASVTKKTFFGGLYQLVVIDC